MNAHTPMVVAAAKALCKRTSAACEINAKSDWIGYSEEYLDDAQAALDASGALDLLAELQNIADADPSKWAKETQDQFQPWAQSRARAAIAKATEVHL